MPEIDLIFSREEHEAIVSWMLQQGCSLTPSHLPGPEALQIRNISDYRLLVDRQEHLFHVRDESFQIAPLEIRSTVNNDGQLRHWVSQRKGGPTIDILGPYDFCERGLRRVSSGSVSHDPSFWNPITGRNEHVPAELARFYKRILRQVKSNATRYLVGKRTYWIGHSTEQLFRQGSAASPE